MNAEFFVDLSVDGSDTDSQRMVPWSQHDREHVDHLIFKLGGKVVLT